MKTTSNVVSKISVASGLVLAIALAVWWSVAAQAADKKHDAHGGHHVTQMSHITTQAEAEALKPARRTFTTSVPPVFSSIIRSILRCLKNNKSS